MPSKYYYDKNSDTWKPVIKTTREHMSQNADLKDNSKDFHKDKIIDNKKILKPIYKEISYYNPKGDEIYKVSSLDAKLKNISDKNNTYLKAENYYEKSLKLKRGEIFVSHVIGEYVSSPVIGKFSKKKAKKAGIAFDPKKYGYAGVENPKGKKFSAIIRFVTPVFSGDKLKGYLTLALDHSFVMDFTDYVDPMSVNSLNISDASSGNYAFMWDNNFGCISHPRDYFIMGYDAKTGKRVPGWIDSEMQKKFKKSHIKDLNTFLQTQPHFLNQSLKKRPNMEQLKKGEVGLDCRYLNFAPQCDGWHQLVDDGGYGSFVIFWSGVWKLTTAATIPYYTGDYADSKVGFGFVTMGANVDEFHKSATQTKEKIKTVLDSEKNNIQNSIVKISSTIFKKIKEQINHISIITILLSMLVIYIAIILSNYITNRLKDIIIGTKKIKNQNFNYEIKKTSKDELGILIDSFNEMAKSIYELNKDLNNKLYTDDLTNLKNRRSYKEDVKLSKNPILYLIDIDFFKNINDYYGIEAGNFVLKEFAKSIKKFANIYGLKAYRVGSDEFLLLQDEQFSQEVANKVVKEFTDLILNKKFIDQKENIDIMLSVTFGISYGEGNLLEESDLALNEAKNKKVPYMIFNNTNLHMNRHKEHLLWRQKIQYAVENDLIVPFFQKIVDLKNPQNEKYESLIRMIDEDKIISPFMFLEIAKETKLYPELTKIMIEKTFKICSKRDATFSVNLSMDDISNTQTINFIRKKLDEYDVSDKIIFEILESEEIYDFSIVLSFIQEMKKRGIRFAIDDFGSGYSNFSYLLQIEPDFIKIDGSIIKNLRENSNEYHIVSAVVKFAKALNAKIVAEHVSSKEIVDILQKFDIDYMQGYYFSEPTTI